MPGTKSYRHTHARQPGQRSGQGEDVGQVVRQRVTVAAKFPCHGGRHRAGDHITDLEGLLKIVGNHAADFLRLQVIGVVIPMAQHIGANHDATFHLITKPLGAGLQVHVVQVGVLVGPEAKLDAIKTTQVARCFGGRDDVINRNR